MPENTTQKDTKWLITCGLLVLCCFLLTAILLILHKNNQNGRYDFFGNTESSFSFYVLDTKTGQVWYRMGMVSAKEPSAPLIDFGTPANPTFRIIGSKPLTQRPTLEELAEGK